jgi:hypothetical protein
MPRSEPMPGRPIPAPGGRVAGSRPALPGHGRSKQVPRYADGRLAVAVAQPDQEVITVSAIPARRARTTRLARTLGLDGNPLRRATDRAMTWIRLGLLAAFLAGGPLAAIGAGNWMYHAGMTQARAQAADRHSARAVLLEPAVPPVTTAASGGDGQAQALAQWQGPGTAPRTGEVLATLGSPAGSTVTVWLDASGKLTRPPLQPAQITDRTIVAAVLAPAVLALSLLTALRLAQRLADRRRLAAWDAAWSTVGPQWTRRRP